MLYLYLNLSYKYKYKYKYNLTINLVMTSIRRINNELKKFSDTINNFNINAECCKIHNQLYIEDNLLTTIGIYINENMIIKIDINKDYPFKPPNVYVETIKNNFEQYDRWSSKIIDISVKSTTPDYLLAWIFTIINNPKLSVGWDFIPTNKCKKCLCCESIICTNNWHPGIQISNIFIEYICRRKFVNNCSKIRQRLMKSIFENDRWTIPDDIILYIVQILIDSSV